MQLNEKTKLKLIGILLNELHAKSEALVQAKVSLAATETSWECAARFAHYTPPADAPPVKFDDTQRGKATYACGEAVKRATADYEEARTELHAAVCAFLTTPPTDARK